jgi:hypothetical protein
MPRTNGNDANVRPCPESDDAEDGRVTGEKSAIEAAAKLFNITPPRCNKIVVRRIEELKREGRG